MPRRIEVEEELSKIGDGDHSLTAEYRIFGPPGTGKTTKLTQQTRRASQRFGQASVLVTSFSRAAAAELAGQDLPVSEESIGTLHSHCWRALGRPKIAEANVEEWNETNRHLQISPLRKLRRLDGEEPDEDSSESARAGDRMLSAVNRYRGMMQPEGAWPTVLREFSVNWNRYKTSHQLWDFCDLIETSLLEIRVAPKRPAVILADEAQDLNPMQLRVVRQWGGHAEYLVLAADDDQTIYSWCGATPEGVLDPAIPEDHTIILNQSYRVPRKVHGLASKLIHQVSRRQEKLYLPRPEDGLLVRLPKGGYRSPEYGILKSAVQHLERGQTVMFLAACSYMLHPIVAVLQKHGIPFHNPYRKACGFWNPLRIGRPGASANRISSLLVAHPEFGGGQRMWRCDDLKLWTEWLTPKGNLTPDARRLIGEWDGPQEIPIDSLNALFEPSAFDSLLAALNGSSKQLLDWYRRRVAPAFHARVQIPLTMANHSGPAALRETPRVIVGTIHSVKGGEADVVFLFPDLSRAGDTAYLHYGAQRDSVIRLFYVGMTRAREALYICPKESAMAIRI